MTGLQRDLDFERAHGGAIGRSGDIETLGDGTRVWLNGTQWARDETDAAISATSRRRMRA
jgi:hypothetical protein